VGCAGERTLPTLLLPHWGPVESDSFPVVDDVIHKTVKPGQLFEMLTYLVAPDRGDLGRARQVIPQTFDAQLGERLPLRILLAEDNLINQKLAVRMLSRLGYQADLAKDGQEAIAAVQNQVYDLVLMDIQMPIMDGLEATRFIRTHICRKLQPKIVAVSANVLQIDRENCRQAGIDDYLTKPLLVEELVRVLKNSRIVAESLETAAN